MKKQLPPRPNLEQLKKQAKALLKETTADAGFSLAAAQFAIANEYGFATWARLKEHVALLEQSPAVKSLREAARQGDLARLRSLLDAQPELINETGGSGVRTALHEAVGGGQEAAVLLLLKRGADPNIRCEGDNAYPLHFAAEKGNFAIIRLLVEHGGDTVGEGDYHELGVIGWATAWEYVQAKREIVDYLLAHGARHNIFSAVAMGEAGVIRELVSRSPADLERRMDLANRRRMPLHLAVVKKQPDALQVLLELGANTESLDEAGFTALDQAALIGESGMAQTLLDRGAKVRLPAAVMLHRTRDIEKLLRKDPDCLKPGGRWGNLIIRASERAPGAVIETLIAAGASVKVRDDPKTAVDSTFGYTALHAAAFHGNKSAAAVLLKHGADVRAREEKYHGTPAGWANYAGHTEVRDLILRGAVDIMEAVEYGLTERVAAIVAEDPGALNRAFQEYPIYPLDAAGSQTPLAYACALGKTEVARWLVEHGADETIPGPES